MYITANAEPVAAIRADARRRAERVSVLDLVRRWIVRHEQRRMELAVLELGHPGVMAEMRRASGRRWSGEYR